MFIIFFSVTVHAAFARMNILRCSFARSVRGSFQFLIRPSPPLRLSGVCMGPSENTQLYAAWREQMRNRENRPVSLSCSFEKSKCFQ
jgi:hypothetical protein